MRKERKEGMKEQIMVAREEKERIEDGWRPPWKDRKEEMEEQIIDGRKGKGEKEESVNFGGWMKSKAKSQD